MSKEIDDILEQSTGLIMAFHELHNKLPEMQEISKQIEQELKSFKNLGKKQVDELTKTTEENLKKISNKINEAEMFLDSINKSLNEKNEELNDKIENIQKNLQSIAKNIKSEKSNNKGNVPYENINIDILLDYIHPRSIKYLYDKYNNTDIPVIVRKIIGSEISPKSWSENYCFYVRGIDIVSDKAIGDYYENAKLLPKDDKYKPNIKYSYYVLCGNKAEVQKIIELEKNKG